MRLSIFTTITNPEKRGDNWGSSFNCYKDLSDELVIVNGGVKSWKDYPTITTYKNDTWLHQKSIEWPQEFSWEFIGEQFQRGYEACTGDVVIHADLDFIFHEKDFDAIRKAAQDMLNNNYPAMSFYKYQFIQPDRYNLKSRLVIMVNRRDYGNRIQFNLGGDLCQPSLDGNELKPNDVPESKIAFYNYEKMTKTKDQIKDDVGRMARAWQRHFGEYKLGGPDDDSAYQEWLNMIKGRYSKPQTNFNLNDHPKYVKETIKNLKPDQFGRDGFGELNA